MGLGRLEAPLSHLIPARCDCHICHLSLSTMDMSPGAVALARGIVVELLDPLAHVHVVASLSLTASFVQRKNSACHVVWGCLLGRPP
jgi:hypothetical protein